MVLTATASGHVTVRSSEAFPVGAVQAPRSPDACVSLASAIPGASRAAVVQAGAFLPPGPSGGADSTPQAIDVPRPCCRVSLTLRPSGDSEITVELWMPVDGWNGKFQAVGNGAFTGSINYTAMATALRRGYAVASTDTGHAGGGARWALGHPEKVIDFGWRAVHEMVVVSKRIVAAYYQSPARFAYWNGCSAGGRQGMKEAQRFPEDFDGVIAGAPGLDWTGRAAQANRVAKVLESNSAARLSEPDRQLLHRAVLDACDALDGLKDGLLDSPSRCAVDPATLECKPQQTAGCLTAAQVETARMIYSGAENPKTRRLIPGLARGSELGWTDLGWTASARATGLDQFRFLVFRDPRWNLQRFDFDRDIVLAEDRDADTINALDPNIDPFIRRGGKLIQYHGWSDPQISPLISVQYYARMVSALGIDRVNSAHRLYMAPGMGHCGGGAGPSSFDMLGALEQWVESGKAPDAIVASHVTGGVVDRTRPLCPYPQVAVYSGSGNPDDAKNFACRATGEAGVSRVERPGIGSM